MPASEIEQAAAIPSVSPIAAGYEILSLLGHGGMGVVYKARQTKLNRLVALKMLLGGSHAGALQQARFLNEVQALARMQHVNIVQLYEYGAHESGALYFTLELVDGGSLAARLDGTPLRPATAAALVEAVARGVHYAHGHGVVHRDLKPANVLLAGDGPLEQCTPKITDFGLAKQVESDSALTQTGAIMGTPQYMAPEQVDGKANAAGPAADIYALGALLYECLTGRPPFHGATALEILEQVLHHDPVAPTRLQPNAPRDLETICLKCLHKDPARRYASAEELVEELQRFQKGEPIRARPIGLLERGLKWVKRYPAVAASLGVIGVVTLLAALLVGWQYRVAVAERDEVRQQHAIALANAQQADAVKHLAERNADQFKAEKEIAEQAVKELRLALDNRAAQFSDRPLPTVYEELLLALAYAQRQQPVEAKRWLGQANRQLEGNRAAVQASSSVLSGAAGPLAVLTALQTANRWHDPQGLELRRLQREVEALLKD